MVFTDWPYIGSYLSLLAYALDQTTRVQTLPERDARVYLCSDEQQNTVVYVTHVRGEENTQQFVQQR